MLKRLDRVGEIVKKLSQSKEKDMLHRIINILVELYRRTVLSENQESEIYKKYSSKVRAHIDGVNGSAQQEEKRKHSLMHSYSKKDEYTEKISLLKIEELVKVLGKGIAICIKKRAVIEDGQPILLIVESILGNMLELIKTRNNEKEEKSTSDNKSILDKVLKDLTEKSTQILNSFVQCIKYLSENTNSNRVLSVIKSIFLVHSQIREGRTEESILSTDAMRSILVALAHRHTPNILEFLFMAIEKDSQTAVYDIILHAVKNEIEDVESLVEAMSTHLTMYKIDITDMNEHKAHFLHLLFICRRYSSIFQTTPPSIKTEQDQQNKEGESKSLNKNENKNTDEIGSPNNLKMCRSKKEKRTLNRFTIEEEIANILEGKYGIIEEYLTAETVNTVFQHRSILCTVGTVMHLYMRNSNYIKAKKINAPIKESISAVIALIYQTIDYEILAQAAEDQRDTGLFYIHCVLMHEPMAILEIDARRVFKEPSNESILQYTCVLYTHSETWLKIQERCRKTGKCGIRRKKKGKKPVHITEEKRQLYKFESVKTQSTKNIKKICNICRTDRVVREYIKKIKRKSILWMVIETDKAGIKEYLDSKARTPGALAVFLEKAFPQINIDIHQMRSLQYLDPSETFMYPEKVRLLPRLEYTSKIASALEDIFLDDEEKRTIWLLFLESLIKEVYQVRHILTEAFHLQVLIRSPKIAQIICQNHSRRREEIIIQLSIEVLEGTVQTTEQEESNAHAALKTLAESTKTEEVSKDIIHYLSRKRSEKASHKDLRNTSQEKKRAPTQFTRVLDQARIIESTLSNTDMCSAPLDAHWTPIDFIRKKEIFFRSVDKLSPIERQCIKDYFSNKNISYECHLRSNNRVLESSGHIKQIVDLFYDPSLHEIDPVSVPENSCVHIVNGLIHSLYPEKHFLFLLLTKTIAKKRSLSDLEVLSINHALEYLYAYDRDLFRELNRIIEELPASKRATVDHKSIPNHSEKETAKITASPSDLLEPSFVHVNEICQPENYLQYIMEEKARESTLDIRLRLRRHGAISNAKQKIILARYQYKFFTKYYNTKDIEKVISEYLKGLSSLASLRVLLFMCAVPDSIEEVLVTLPCESSKEFLKIFYYAFFGANPPEEHLYLGIARILRKDKNMESSEKPPELAEEAEGLSNMVYNNSEIRMYCNREKDNGFMNKYATHKEENADMLESEDILKASIQLTKWAVSVDKTEEISYIFSNSIVARKKERYIDFLQAKGVIDRFKFLNSVKTGKTYTGSTEVEEILCICTRKNEDIYEALNTNKTLTKNGMHCAVTALEQKWLSMPAEVYYINTTSERQPVPVISEIVKSYKKISSTQESTDMQERKRRLAANLILFKIEQNMHTAKTPLFLLDKIEKDCIERIRKKREESELSSAQKIPKELQIHQKEEIKTFSISENKILSKTLAAKIEYIVKEFEKKPIDVLNDHVKPYLSIDFGKESISITETLAKTCITIFNRYAMDPSNTPAPSTKKTKSNRILQKEEAAAKELHECKARQYTEVEETAHALGIKLYIQLAEKRQKTQHIISLVHLLFSQHAPETTIQNISLENIPTRCFLPLKQQVISKLLHLRIDKRENISLYRHVHSIVERFLNEFPFMVIYDLISREKKKDESIAVSPTIRAHAEAVIGQYRNIYNQIQSALMIFAVFPAHTPVVSSTHPAQQTECYIHKILPEVKRLKGINKPVMISVLGSNGLLYKEILKKNDDLKQDILSTQVFSYMNTVLSSSLHTRTLKERIRTYNIVAFDQLFGIIEFISTAEPIGNIIEELHSKHYPNEINTMACREILQKYIDRPLERKIKVLKYVYASYSPVLKKIFNGKGPFEYCKQRKAFTNSFSITSIATYILGLGDRHPHNILLDRHTQELINIDLNLIFDQGKALAISEKVPFRMTRNMQQGIIAAGEHSYDKAMERFLRALKGSKENLLVFVSILQNEPLQRWKAIQKIAQIETMFSDYKSILNRLKDKLNGIEDGFILGTSAHVQCLVQRAVDISNHASIYPGWSPWM